MHCALEAHARFPSRTRGEGKKVFGILDMAVYKEGAYRLYGSTKLRQNRFLTHREDRSEHGLSRATFLASLVQHFAEPVTRLLRCSVPAGETLRTDLLRPRHAGRLYLARSGVNALPLPLLQRILQLAEGAAMCAAVCRRWHLAVTGSCLATRISATLVQQLRQVVMRETAACGIEGPIKEAPLLFAGVYGRCVVFGQVSRRCELSWQTNGRDHKGNSIYWVLFPDLGVFYHKCHDAECKQRVRSEQPSLLPEIELETVEGEGGGRGCLLRNRELQVEALIALEGRGIVRRIPTEVLFCVRWENVPRREQALEVRRLAESSLTVVQVSDLVRFENETQLFAVRAVDEREGTARLEAFDGAEGTLLCDRKMVLMLRLMGALVRIPTQIASSCAFE